VVFEGSDEFRGIGGGQDLAVVRIEGTALFAVNTRGGGVTRIKQSIYLYRQIYRWMDG